MTRAGLIGSILSGLDAQRGGLFPWVAVLYGAGIGLYFSLRFEPDGAHWAGLACVALVLAMGIWRAGPGVRLVLMIPLVVASGIAVAGWRAHGVAEEVLSFRYYGPVEGRIIAIDRSQSDAPRLTLDRVRLRDVPPGRTPARVRVSLHGDQRFIDPAPGQIIGLTGHLSPPSGAVEPGGFDFRRHAWFLRLGAVGYTRTPALVLAPAEPGGLRLGINRIRQAVSAHVRAVLPGREGGFAVAITTGERSHIDRAVLDDLRAANLAHLLAISGLHMGLLTGFVFASLRYGLAPFALRWPTRKIAALGALIAGAAYLALSGGNVATERAFVMVAVMFAALLLNRRAVTLRAVAVAALIVLTLRPEALYGPGFQMSFAATTALVAVFGALRRPPGEGRRWPRGARFVFGVAVSSLVAGMATAPIAAAHFNQVPHYGLIANMLSVPLMGAVVIPGAVLAALLAPFGLSWIGLGLMAPAIRWILAVAETVAGWPGALSFVPMPGTAVLPLLAAGALWLVIWRGPFRWCGAPVMGLALALWPMAERPLALVSPSGGLVGVLGAEGRILSKARGDGFAARVWLENDGDPVEQAVAHGRGGDPGRLRAFDLGSIRLVHGTGKAAAREALAFCGRALVVVNVSVNRPAGCDLYDPKRLRREGALALRPGPSGIEITSAREVTGHRLWSP
ncbi:MAG: ComEC family competence protein [Silicimonas sp.]|nr:ComEC family competence protein [Silicimonas sp.]